MKIIIKSDIKYNIEAKNNLINDIKKAILKYNSYSTETIDLEKEFKIKE